MTPLDKFWKAPKELKRPLVTELADLAELAELAGHAGETAPAATAPVPWVERRAQRRIKMQAAIDLASDTNFYAGFSTDISTGGVFVATVCTLPVGREVDLAFTLPSGACIEVRGTVRWTREVNDKLPESFPGMGIQFTDLSELDRQAIERFVQSREPMFFPD